jgi:hypothetical protein
MNVIDKILEVWSYRCSDGIVDMNNPDKAKILQEILDEKGLNKIELEEVNGVSYDDVIKNALKIDQIPQVQDEYKLGENVNINGEDAKIFKALYHIAPPKANKGVEGAGSKGRGHGEIALYWLFAHQLGHTASGNQGGGKPDLIIDGKGVEVKAYDSKIMGLGRIGSDKDNIDLLNTLFGLHSLVSTIEHVGKDKKANALNFSKTDIENAFSTLQDFSNNEELRKLIPDYSLIESIYSKVDSLITKLAINSPFTSEEAAAALVKKILLKKLETKPGFGGFIVNINENGLLNYKEINKEKITSLDSKDILNNTSINQGSVIINPDNLFL